MQVAVAGAGISGLVSAYILAKEGVDVVLYEKEDYLGRGHARTVNIEGVDINLGSIIFIRASIHESRSYEWGIRNGLSSLFAQKKNLLNPYFYRMIREILKFKDEVIKSVEDLESNPDIHSNETLEHFVKSHGYSELFQKVYLLPLCALIWSSPSEDVLSFFSFFCTFIFLKPPATAVTFNPPIKPENTLLKWSKSHPIPSVAASKASFELNAIQGKKGIWFCGAYHGLNRKILKPLN
ncbi:hypothetical protein GIB67_034413 [Kingdonia uniflora]|uniref:Uncharacterized protein n=1 Tax=Kingdonia uniflora TaxID=39325 RepID=A0A7J7NS54_9MAGN|nr:hypothetical protein GIB67_034413 [Kingdonia uniflora]